jgi:hypothetical protein
MARLASQAKGGFYAAAPEAVAAVLDRLLAPKSGECLVLDPCAGRGDALLQLCDALEARPFAIELDEQRARITEALVGKDALYADFTRTAISPRSFSLVWCNPPYDHSTGGMGRVENEFLRRAAELLVDGGVMCFVAPEDVCDGRETFQTFEGQFSDISAMPFPEPVRKYNETILLGVKRRNWNPLNRSQHGWLDEAFGRYVVYDLPAGHRPKRFLKAEPTDEELVRLVAASPLRHLLAGSSGITSQKLRPPMSIGIGHRAMLLASGFLNGLIAPPGEPPHVIRGTCSKEQYMSDQSVSEDDEGNSTTRTVLSEKAKLSIRVLDHGGRITTLE